MFKLGNNIISEVSEDELNKNFTKLILDELRDFITHHPVISKINNSDVARMVCVIRKTHYYMNLEVDEELEDDSLSSKDRKSAPYRNAENNKKFLRFYLRLEPLHEIDFGRLIPENNSVNQFFEESFSVIPRSKIEYNSSAVKADYVVELILRKAFLSSYAGDNYLVSEEAPLAMQKRNLERIIYYDNYYTPDGDEDVVETVLIEVSSLLRISKLADDITRFLMLNKEILVDKDKRKKPAYVL